MVVVESPIFVDLFATKNMASWMFAINGNMEEEIGSRARHQFSEARSKSTMKHEVCTSSSLRFSGVAMLGYYNTVL